MLPGLVLLTAGFIMWKAPRLAGFLIATSAALFVLFWVVLIYRMYTVPAP